MPSDSIIDSLELDNLQESRESNRPTLGETSLFAPLNSKPPHSLTAEGQAPSGRFSRRFYPVVDWKFMSLNQYLSLIFQRANNESMTLDKFYNDIWMPFSAVLRRNT